MESLVSDHAVASHREEAIAPRGQYFRGERRRGEDWPTIAFIRRTRDWAFPWETALSYLVRDNDGAYGPIFWRRVRAVGIRDRPISPRSPWQNPYAERLIGTLRRDCLDMFLSSVHGTCVGITCQRPLHGAVERDESLVQQWLKQDYPRIRALAQREKAEIYFGDAAHMRSDHHAGRTWG